MDTIFLTGTIHWDMHLFLKFSFSLEVQIGCSGFSETERHNLLFVLYCLPNHVGFLPFCLCARFWLNPLLINSSSLSSRKGKITCRTISAWSMSSCLLGSLLPARSQVFILAGPPQTPPCQEVICLHVSAVLSPAVLFVFSSIYLNLDDGVGCFLLDLVSHHFHSHSLPDGRRFLMLVCGFPCRFSIWKKTSLGLRGQF